MTKYEIRRLTALLILTGLITVAIVTETHRHVLAAIWPTIQDFFNYLSA